MLTKPILLVSFLTLLLREVRDKVLTPSNNVKAFETCGYYPFNFEASYANRHVPPSSDPNPDSEDGDERELVLKGPVLRTDLGPEPDRTRTD
jgi:hypothetical protein